MYIFSGDGEPLGTHVGFNSFRKEQHFILERDAVLEADITGATLAPPPGECLGLRLRRGEDCSYLDYYIHGREPREYWNIGVLPATFPKPTSEHPDLARANRLYAWEEDCVEDLLRDALSVEEAKALAARVMKWYGLPAPGIERMTVVMSDTGLVAHQGRWNEERWAIQLVRPNTSIVVHECAHGVAGKLAGQKPGDVGHGPIFAGVLVEILHRFAGYDKGQARNEMMARGICCISAQAHNIRRSQFLGRKRKEPHATPAIQSPVHSIAGTTGRAADAQQPDAGGLGGDEQGVGAGRKGRRET